MPPHGRKRGPLDEHRRRGGDGVAFPRKDGPGISQSDILVINKTDLAPYVHADLEVVRRDSELMRPGKPFLFTNCMTGEGVNELVELLRKMALFDIDLHAKNHSENQNPVQ